jgi:hypothetical protein
MSERRPTAGEIAITIPWTPDAQCNPNNHRCSERTKIRHRKIGADEARYPIMAAYREANRGRGPLDEITPFPGPCVLDVTVRWGYGQKAWDPSNIWIALKYVIDQLERLGIVANDKHLQMGTVTQERAKNQPETVLVVRAS